MRHATRRSSSGPLLALATAGLLAAAPIAAADIQTVGDGQGRAITFDLQASGVDVPGYASILSAALHGDEIGSVTVRVVPQNQIPALCGSGASACYRIAGGEGTITVPARTAESVRHALLHEYGHHVDFSIGTPQATGRGGDGTPGWWDARAVSQLLADGSVAYDYSKGWSHSIAEIYAEDYVQAHGDSSFGISWLPRPPASVLDAVRRDITGSPVVPPPFPPDPAPSPPPSSPDPAPGAPVETIPPGTRTPGANGSTSPRGRAGMVVRGRTTRSRGRQARRYAGFVRAGRAVSIPLRGAGRRRVGARIALSGSQASVGAALVCGRRRIVATRGTGDTDALLPGRRARAGACRIVLRNRGEATARFRVLIVVGRR